MRQLLVVTIAATLLPAYAGAQGLAEAAAKEREKRKGQKAAKVITEDDLQKAGQSGNANVNTGAVAPAAAASPVFAEAAAAASAADKPKAKGEEELRAEQQQAWHDKLKKAEGELKRLSELQDSIQKNLNDITGNIYGAQRTTLLSGLDKTKAELQAARLQLEALQEEGRRNHFR